MHERLVPWTPRLKWWFVALELAGIYVAPAVLLALTVGGLLLAYGGAVFFRVATPSFAGAGSFVLGGLVEPHPVVALLAFDIVASIFVTRAAFRNQAWAHWGAVTLIAASMLPAILVALAWHELAIWVLALAYCAACAAFLVAMTYAFVKHGPWGVRAQGISR